MEKRNHSLNRRLFLWILIIIIPITSFIVFENLYAINVVRNQVSISNQGTLKLYVQQIKETLNGAEKYLANLAYNNEIITGVSKGEDDYEKYMQSQLLLTEVTSAKIVYPQIDGFFVVSINGQRIVKKTNGTETLENLEDIRKYLINLTTETEESFDANKGKWFGKKFADDYYLLRLYRTNNYLIGAWIKIDNLLAPLVSSEFAFDKHLAVASIEDGVYSDEKLMSNASIKKEYLGGSYSILGDENRYLLLSQPFEMSGLYLVALIKEKGILEGLDNLQSGITFISFLSLLMIPLSLYLVNRAVVSPLKSIVRAMLKVKQGSLDVEIIDVPEYTEYIVVQDTFKDMIEQIKDLKIDVYEEQLLKHKAQMQYYQLQISPHFIMNTLNIIYGLAEVKKYEIIQQMTLSLVKYFRSILIMSRETVVMLVQETEHVKNYLQIQELRFPGTIRYAIHEEQGLENIMVPPILIHSFVENAVKYAREKDGILSISVNIGLDTGRLIISIEDEGEGFPDEILKLLNAKQFESKLFFEHFGIQNIVQRLDYLYQEDYNIRFSNGSRGGAKIVITLPLKKEFK